MLKKLLLILLFLIIVAFIFIIALPSIISTHFGKEQILHFANKQIPGTLTADEIKLTWNGPQILKNLSLKDPEGNLVGTISEFTTDAPLLSFRSKQFLNYELNLSGLSGTIIGREGSTNIDHALGTSSNNTLPFTLTLKEANGKVHYSPDQNRVKAFLQGTTIYNGLEGRFDFDLTAQGKELKNSDLITFNGMFQQLPIKLVCQFIRSNLCQQIEAVLGSSINADIKGQLQQMAGPIFLKANGENGDLTLDGYLDRNGILTLKAPLKATTKVSPQLIRYVLKPLSPLFGDLLPSKEQIKLTISPEHSQIPLNHFSLETLVIPQGKLDLGKLKFSGQGQLRELFELFKTSDKDNSIWLTPLYFQFNRGLLKLSRFDLLLMDKYHFALWGKADLIKDKIDAMVAISGSALKQLFNISGLEKNYMMQLPIKGSVKKPYVDQTKAMAKIGALVAQNQKRPEVSLFGAILGIASGELTEDPLPQPTTQPFPWEN